MRPSTYDTIIDTTKELCGYGGWFLLTALMSGFILSVIYLIIVEGFEINVSIMLFIIIDLTISSLIIMFVFMVKKAHQRFKVDQWRDCWMAFGHPVRIPFKHSTEEKLIIWLDENTPRLYRIIAKNVRDNTATVVFRHKTDAMACKLKWT